MTFSVALYRGQGKLRLAEEWGKKSRLYLKCVFSVFLFYVCVRTNAETHFMLPCAPLISILDQVFKLNGYKTLLYNYIIKMIS